MPQVGPGQGGWSQPLASCILGASYVPIRPAASLLWVAVSESVKWARVMSALWGYHGGRRTRAAGFVEPHRWQVAQRMLGIHTVAGKAQLPGRLCLETEPEGDTEAK